MGGLTAKNFPFPSQIGGSPNVTPLTTPQAPQQNGPNTTQTLAGTGTPLPPSVGKAPVRTPLQAPGSNISSKMSALYG